MLDTPNWFPNSTWHLIGYITIKLDKPHVFTSTSSTKIAPDSLGSENLANSITSNNQR